MSSNPKKWKANQAKVKFVMDFPGMLKSWEECRGKTIQEIVPLSTTTGVVFVMSDNTFLVASPLDLDPKNIQEGLKAARSHLEDHYTDAYQELERLTLKDRKLTRQSRLENILGAVRNNAPNIPELKKELQKLLDSLPDG